MRGKLLVALTSAGLVCALVVAAAAGAGASNRQVNILDNCDGPSFNAALGAGSCVRGGGLTFETFLTALVEKGEVSSWRFSPGQLKVDSGGTITAVNRGGEFHTFTPVASFGGGCIDVINQLLGLTPVPECAGFPAIFGATGVDPGASRTTAPLAGGIQRFQCLIHPWQRTTVEVG
ncbi:MAG TPA: hypothetical protein VJM07_08855 [Gaiella sp.]|jgi:hypothetical protein|nr:hypothetical protein [Gaiella sp.]